jgi:hypothetical protein
MNEDVFISFLININHVGRIVKALFVLIIDLKKNNIYF